MHHQEYLPLIQELEKLACSDLRLILQHKLLEKNHLLSCDPIDLIWKLWKENKHRTPCHYCYKVTFQNITAL